jgi:hypothetical protein
MTDIATKHNSPRTINITYLNASTPKHAIPRKSTSLLKSLVKERRSRKASKEHELQGSINKIREVSLIWEEVKEQISPHSIQSSPKTKTISQCLTYRDKADEKSKSDKPINVSPLHLKTLPFKKYLNNVSLLKNAKIQKVTGDLSPASDKSNSIRVLSSIDPKNIQNKLQGLHSGQNQHIPKQKGCE